MPSLSLRPLAALAAIAVAACTTVPRPPAPPPKPPVTPVAPPEARVPAKLLPASFAELPGWNDDRVDEAWPAFLAGCKRLVAMPARADAFREPCGAAAALQASAAALAPAVPPSTGDAAATMPPSPGTATVRAFFEAHFSVWSVTAGDGDATGLATGYYEPLLAGSRERGARFTTPLYAPPDDLLTVDLASLFPELAGKRVRARLEGRKVVPYWTRAELEQRAPYLVDKVLVWVDDPVDAFFLEIQGSGRVKLDDGSVLRVGYADQNGQPFKPVARVLIERGALTRDNASMQAIRAWGRENPAELPALLDENPSFVFFRIVPPAAPGSLEAAIDGPIGALGVPLLRERAIAVDPRSVPLGAPVYIATTRPLSDAPMNRLTMAQDTGGAIRGAVRADFFWGFGGDAPREAGRMKQPLRMWLLWPTGAGTPPAPR